MSRFKPYPAYKDSGAEWLGELPEHWSASSLERCFKIQGGATPSPDELYWNGRIAWATPADLSGLNSLFLTQTKRTITPEGLASCGTAIVSQGALILSTRAPIGSLAIALQEMCTNQGCKALVANSSTSSLYYAYVLLTAKDELNNRGRGTTFLEISGDELGRFSVPSVPISEQTQIARFLDHETARIDALIKEQQHLIELLKEKRQAVISQAVTKGLDPSVSMKDSGVEWLGKVPAHWIVSRAKLVSDIFVPQRNKPELNDSEGIAWVTMEDMNDGYISATNLKVTELAADQAGSKVLKTGAVIASCVGRLGVVAINSVDVVINQQLQAFAPKNIKAEYLRNIVSVSKEYFELIGTAATLVYVNQQGFENLPVLIPSASEQESICLHVDEASARFDSLLSESFEAIQLLQERRSALISAAVTGKIDVRGWQPPAPAQAPAVEAEEAV